MCMNTLENWHLPFDDNDQKVRYRVRIDRVDIVHFDNHPHFAKNDVLKSKKKCKRKRRKIEPS